MAALLDRKTAVVYGAGGSVGGAVARTFAREGARVFLVGRTRAKLDAVANDIANDPATRAAEVDVAEVDVLDEAATVRHADAVASSAGAIDIAFNAMGYDGITLGTPIIELGADAFAKPVGIAARAQLITAKAAARHMVSRGSGVILTITSSHARQAIPNFGPVGMIQAAIEGLYRQLAGELGPRGVRVVCLRSSGSPDAPGLAAVGDMMARTAGLSREEMETRAKAAVPLRRFPMLAEVANVAAFMASDRASPITGAVANLTCGAIVE